MSYIDTFDHELVGFFAGLPVYHPLEVMAGTDPWNFGCTPSQLVVGGGDGEHPAMLLKDPGSATLRFLEFALGPEPEKQYNMSEGTMKTILDSPTSWHCLQYAGWSLRTLARFYERCTSPSFPHPYKSEEFSGGIEDWLVASLGEFVYFAMPDLGAAALDTVPEVRAVVRSPLLFNVLILPPGYTTSAGRQRDAQGVVIWGNYRWVARSRSGETDR